MIVGFPHFQYHRRCPKRFWLQECRCAQCFESVVCIAFQAVKWVLLNKFRVCEKQRMCFQWVFCPAETILAPLSVITAWTCWECPSHQIFLWGVQIYCLLYSYTDCLECKPASSNLVKKMSWQTNKHLFTSPSSELYLFFPKAMQRIVQELTALAGNKQDLHNPLLLT